MLAIWMLRANISREYDPSVAHAWNIVEFILSPASIQSNLVHVSRSLYLYLFAASAT